MGKPKIFCQIGIGLVVFACVFIWNGASAAFHQPELKTNLNLGAEAAKAFYPNAPVEPVSASQASGCLSLVPQQKLTIPVSVTFSNETSIAVSGDTMAVGAPNNTIGNVARQGSVNIFVRSGTTWALQQQVTAPDGAYDDRFGTAVALSGNTLVVGTPGANIGNNADQGAAYVFQRSGTTWGFVQKLIATDGFRFEGFGYDVALENGTIVVGCPSDQIIENSAVGSAYVFVLNGSWGLQQKLAISDSSFIGSGFGTSVAISGNTAVIGATGAYVAPNSNQGAAYVWVRNGVTWTLQQQLVAQDGSTNDYFALSIALEGDTAVISRASATVGANAGQGAAYVFARSGVTWSVQQVVTAQNGNAGDGFSSKLALSGNSLLIYAPNADTFISDSGWAYLFERNGTSWTELQEFSGPDGQGLPNEVALNNGIAAFGSANQVQMFGCSSCPAIRIQPSILPYAITNTFYNQTITATGAQAPYTFSLASGALPNGLALAPNGLLSGTVTAAAHSVFNFTLRATDANGCYGLRSYSLSVTPPCTPLVFSPLTLSDRRVNETIGQNIQISGGTANYTFVLTAGSIPPGITFFNTGSFYGTFTTAGTYSFTLQATDRYGCIGSQAYTWRILPACPYINFDQLPTLPTATPGQFYFQSLTQTGGSAPVVWEVIQDIPVNSGLRFDPVTKIVSGVPRQRANFDTFIGFTLNLKDANNCSVTRTFDIRLHPVACVPVDVQPSWMAGGIIGSHYLHNISLSNVIGSFDIAHTSGQLPSGLLFGGSSVQGTPNAGTAGNYPLTFTGADSNGCTGSVNYVLNVSSCTIGSLSQTSQNASNTTNDYSFAITAPTCSWSANSHMSWITILSGSSGNGNGTVSFRVATNPGPARQGVISVNDKNFYINQAAGDVVADFDQDGIPNGVELGEGTNPAVKDNDIFTNTWQNDRLFVMQQYRDFLGREADLTGANNWTNALYGNSLTRAQAIESFFNSNEFQGNAAPIVRLYFGAFLRIPDYEGLTNWMNAYRAGMPLTSVAQAFATSPEFLITYGALDNTQYVTLLYQNILGRAPDPAGLNGWVNLLNTGTSRGAVLVGFSESQEYITSSSNKVFATMMYVGTLRRSPDVGGFNNWVAYLGGGNSRLNMIQGFIGSQEYHNRFLP